MKEKNQKQTISGHLSELRMRLFWMCSALVLTSVVGFWQQDKLLSFLQKPLNSSLYYTSPTGGFGFIFKLAISFGIVASLPVILHQLGKFIQPAFKVRRRTLVLYSTLSFIFALAGVTFAYIVSLPSALHFLVNFGGDNFQAIITADEYFSFAISYLVGFAVLFQLPLLISIINKITPLKPSKMLKVQRYVIVGSFILAAILTPTPDPFNQLLMALPIIALYQLCITQVAFTNFVRRKRSKTSKQTQSTELLTDTPSVIRRAPAELSVLAVRSFFDSYVTQPSYQNSGSRLIQDVISPHMHGLNASA